MAAAKHCLATKCIGNQQETKQKPLDLAILLVTFFRDGENFRDLFGKVVGDLQGHEIDAFKI